jgi:predicted PurR-regulated permease PerM
LPYLPPDAADLRPRHFCIILARVPIATGRCEWAELTMNAVDPNEKESAGGARVTASRDTAEVRAVVVTFAALALFVYLVGFIVLPFVIAGIIAYICTPLLDWLAGRTGLPRPLLAALLFLLLVGVAGFTIALAGRHLVAEIGNTVTDLQGTLDHLLHRAADGEPVRLFGRSIDLNEAVRGVGDRIHDWLGRPDRLMLVAGFGFAAVIGTFLTVVLLCYFLVSGKSVARGLFWMVPPSRRPLVAQIGRRLDPVLKRYFVGLLVIVIYAVIAAYIGLGVILGVDHAFLLALLTGILETIPIIGSTTAAIIAGLVSLHTATGLSSILAFALYAVLLRLSIDQIVAPLVLGSAANVHPVLIIFCFLSGAVLLGIPGVILAVPAALTVKAALATLYGDDDKID